MNSIMFFLIEKTSKESILRFRQLKKSNKLEIFRIQLEPELQVFAKPVKAKTPKDHLYWSILNLLVCFIFAIPALYFVIRSRKNFQEGELQLAFKNSKRARYCNVIADIIGFFAFMDLLLIQNAEKNGMCPINLFVFKK